MSRPIAVLQMQRLGDLILSFPLFMWLSRTFPDRPIRVVAEPVFYTALARLSPRVTYLPWTEAARLRQERHALVINLSHRPEAAALAGSIPSDEVLGPLLDPDGVSRARGNFALYRASLVGGNRHNRLHWADLNALDAIDLRLMAATGYDPPRRLGAHKRNIGLFPGASQPEKRPDAAFWAELARELFRRGLVPVLFGGPGDVELCREVVRLSGAPVADSSGRMGLAEMAYLGQGVSLLVTPDTGPMHLAAWTGWRVLNLSMGPVNAWETGPYQPGHYVLRTTASCRGCWSCAKPSPLCRRAFSPAGTAFVASLLVRGEEGRLEGLALPGLELLRSGRSGRGLYHLATVAGASACDARGLLAEMWREYFGAEFGLWDHDRGAVAALAEAHPRLSEALWRAVVRLGRELARLAGARDRVAGPEWWRAFPPLIRPLASFVQVSLQNRDYAQEAFREILARFERLAVLVRPD